MSAIVDRYGTVLRIYDNGGKTVDRYTIFPPRWAKAYRQINPNWICIGSSKYTFHPQGFGQHCIGIPGNHLGKRICWNDLPTDVQKFARQSFPEYTPKE